MGKILVEISDDAHNELKVQAIRRNLLLKELVIKILENAAMSFA